ncbi:MAG: type II secretion system F family protein [Candidatus Omnitrophica bacterium]|nr:type II secretion system F family protein [Candidatus Omnitrophota bacterium]MBU4488038.1 type II secretion system F family protein [Candidatus Omnitrophota bacterium]MCG2704720.1 type II secretion system F family protein [Candidatus Omnitrophota bacterium]
MPIYSYKAIDKFGKEIADEVDVASYDEAIKKLRGLGYFPTQITAKRSKASTRAAHAAGGAVGGVGLSMEISIPFLGIGSVNQKQVTLFTRQLATLIGAGLPLVRSLNILRDQMKAGSFRNMVQSVANQVETGSTFSDALLKHPKAFSRLFVNTVKAGETGGVLEVVLTRLAEFSEKSERLKNRIRSALAYPILVIMIALGVLSFLIIFVIPKFMELFKELGTELPLPTLILLQISDFMQHKWLLGIIFIVGFIILYNFALRLEPFRLLIDNIKLHLPVFGVLAQKVAIARFSRTLGTLISSGVPILQALMITKDTAGNEVIARSLGRVHDSIREGESIAGPLAKTKIFPLMVVNMISVGEETGSLDQMLNKVADTYDDEVDVTVTALTSLLEPLLIVGMGLIVGAIVISMFLPLVKLLTTLSA